MSRFRPERVAGQIHKIVSEMLHNGEIKDPRVCLATITEVQVSRDLGLARIFYTVLGNEEERRVTAEGFARVAAYVRRRIGQELALRQVPELRFEYDHSSETGRRIDDLLREARRSEADPE